MKRIKSRNPYVVTYKEGFYPATLDWLKRLVDAARAEFRPAG